jgi:hypothetical protein
MNPMPSRVALISLAMLAALAACKREPSSAPAPAAPGDAAPASSEPAATAEGAVAAAATAIAPLSAKDEIGRMMDAFVAVKSYHVEMTTASPKGDMTTDMDFVAPDRYRMKLPMGTQYVIGDTMYMSMEGRTMKMALPKGQLANYRDPAQIAANKATMEVAALGSDTVDGQAARKFLVRNSQPRPSESTIWVGADGYPLRIDVKGEAGGGASSTTIRYSRFNDPSIRIEPPPQ